MRGHSASMAMDPKDGMANQRHVAKGGRQPNEETQTGGQIAKAGRAMGASHMADHGDLKTLDMVIVKCISPFYYSTKYDKSRKTNSLVQMCLIKESTNIFKRGAISIWLLLMFHGVQAR